MAQAIKPDGAVEACERLLADRKLAVDDLLPEQALELWLDFARTPIDVPPQPEADGLLYQWGIYSFSGQPLFHLDLVRQFALPNDDEYAQFHLDLRLAIDPRLATLGSYSEWWWSDGGSPLETWRTRLTARPEWSVLAGRRPTAVEFFLDYT